jgi:acyl dehydratase
MARTLQPVRLRVDMPAILAYAAITDDFNPIHVDPAFAAKTPMGGVIAHGTMSLNLLWQAIALTFGADAVARGALDVRFARPVRVGDALEAGGAESATQPGTLEVWVRNQDGVAVIEGTATVPA